MEFEIAIKFHDHMEGKGNGKRTRKTNKNCIKENAVKAQIEVRSGPVDCGISQGFVSLNQHIDTKVKTICVLEENTIAKLH